MEVRRSSFRIQHRLLKNGRLAVEGNETRVWVVRDPTRHGRYKAQPMPEHVVARFAQDAGATAPP